MVPCAHIGSRLLHLYYQTRPEMLVWQIYLKNDSGCDSGWSLTGCWRSLRMLLVFSLIIDPTTLVQLNIPSEFRRVSFGVFFCFHCKINSLYNQIRIIFPGLYPYSLESSFSWWFVVLFFVLVVVFLFCEKPSSPFFFPLPLLLWSSVFPLHQFNREIFCLSASAVCIFKLFVH